jgi:predicted DNA-binding transcriptional regulator YafY
MTDTTPILASEVTFNEGLLRLAAVHHKPVTFRYAKGKGDVIETRTLIPSDVKNITEGGVTHATFTGYDPDREEVRAYRADRIKGTVNVA